MWQMKQNWVSMVNQWCQKHSQTCDFSFIACDDQWVCKTKGHTASGATKKEAKQACAKIIYNSCMTEAIFEVKTTLTTCIIIDGDQRADCWKWLASRDTDWDPRKILVKVYTGPTTPVIQCCDDKIEHFQARSAGRDSADAKILMDLGGFLNSQLCERYILVSSDHILVQVAQDIDNIDFAANLIQLKNILDLLN